ncbi:GTP pyrophosphokinase family protein [Zobellia nedashkovskayae]|uniref:GTP pyrophosphokinase n=1 Tax=Zobellia nedashkovskayae TaxID=2779510 RepID=UPI00188A42C7|nr:hypothetical protein [Zobellia nedashkovskayae]
MNQENINKYISLRPTYKKLSEKVGQIIEELLDINNINYHAVFYRAKTIESFGEKIKKPKYKDPLSELTDLAGIRIIGYVEDDVEEISKIIENAFDVDPANSMNKSEDLGVDKVGYKSVHYVCTLPSSRTSLPEYRRFDNLKFEIQIRTILQHSWAEIEHDKNYKFTGELPPEIQRRFKLVAGNLELADREFNQLSRDIDEYSREIAKSTEKGELEINLNSTALKQYLAIKFKKLIGEERLEPSFNGSNNESIILMELRNFGLSTLSDLDMIITPEIEKQINKYEDEGNFLGLCRIIMLASDVKKYLSNSWNNSWGTLAEDHRLMLSELNIDVDFIENYMEENLIPARNKAH